MRADSRQEKRGTARDLARAIKGCKPGRWVALSSDYRRVVANAASASAALKKAKKSGEAGFILYRVPDPEAVYVY